MEIKINLEHIDADGWSVAEIIRAAVEDELKREIRKLVREEIKLRKGDIERAVKQVMTNISQANLQDLVRSGETILKWK